MSDLTWAEKVRRIANQLERHGGGWTGDREHVERLAEHILNAIGDAND